LLFLFCHNSDSKKSKEAKIDGYLTTFKKNGKPKT